MRSVGLFVLLAACWTGSDAPPAQPAPKPADNTPHASAADGERDTAVAITGDPAVGERIYQQKGCAACHTVDGSSRVGPTWKGLWGSTVLLSDGSSVTADRAYIERSIRDPSAQLVQGFPNVMPAGFDTHLSAPEIAGVVAFIEAQR